MRLYFVVLAITVIVPYTFTENSANTLSSKVTNFEFDVFRWAPRNEVGCENFFTDIDEREEPKKADEVLAFDCNRFKLAKECLQSLNANPNSGISTNQQAQNDLNKHDRNFMEAACSGIN